MDVKLVEVSGRVYRSHCLGGPSFGAEQGGGGGRGGTGGEDLDNLDYEDEGDCTIQWSEGMASLYLGVDPGLYKFIIGKGGSKKSQIERDTGASIEIPRPKAVEEGATGLTIRGASEKAVRSARTRVELVVETAVASPGLPYNYFISVPLTSPAVRAALDAFRAGALKDEAGAAAAGLEPSVFVDPRLLHLTVVMLKLYSEEKRQRVMEILDNLELPGDDEGEVGGEPGIPVRLQGLDIMNDDPSMADVVYLQAASQDPARRMEDVCAAVVGGLAEAGLLAEKDEGGVKLHATVINTRYRKNARGGASGGCGGGGGRGAGGPLQRIPIDARGLLAEHGGLDLGELMCDRLELSQRGKFGEEGYYHCAHVRPLAE